MKKRLTHVDRKGSVRMVDVSGKPRTARHASARATVRLSSKTIRLIASAGIPKGDVPAAARIAGIMAAKKTPELIPLCHPLNLASVDIDVTFNMRESTVEIASSVRTVGETGVEMEALTAVAVAALTVYDMCKSVDKGAVLSDIMLVEKSGGKSGTFKRKL
jgi:cyclic pyranopterin phosphate synthase